ncbi:voltage-gatedpotassiumchannel [Moniliophthora roreri MCA 2997]|uniref:Voltage-gatedpotassiumchannel n=1 Tax=Moniliophthora roreri (strain MCA 2997) TaxID=1381753 RepID=V2XI10_MONRO|nr:voltage-gatedpotassiumchannel [Moniliophthora roreri MCA 2997]
MSSSAGGIELSRLRTSTSQFLTEDNHRASSPHIGDIFGTQTSRDDEALAAIHPPWKRDLFALLEQPKSSSSAVLVHILMTALILTSALVTVLETVPAFHSISPQVWFGIETTLVAMFTIEYVARCVAWSGTWRSLFKWMTSFFGIIDLLSVLPYYIEILMQQDTAVFFRFSILRMFRLIRVFRPFRYNNTILLTIEVMYLSVRRSQHALLAISFFVVMVLTIFSTLLYFAERGTWDTTLETSVNSDGDPTQFASIPAAAWFVLVTITTVGYGEITPRSFLGRLVTLPLLVFGLLLIALPSFVLGREFSLVWEKMSSKQEDEDGYHELDSPMEHRHTTFTGPERDLSNRKLAQNQTELSKQISELRDTVEMQGEMIKRLLEVLETRIKGKQRAHQE